MFRKSIARTGINFNFWDLKSEVNEPTIRAYSMANYPEERGILKFNIRVSPPPHVWITCHRAQ